MNRMASAKLVRLCPDWVKRVAFAMSALRPFIPQFQT